MTNLKALLESKRHAYSDLGFKPIAIPRNLFDFQVSLVDWSLRKGRSAIFADCGMGKSAIELVWADNVVRKTNKHVLLLTPLAVAGQMIHEANKFGIEAFRSIDGTLPKSACVVVTNYERLHHFEARDFIGCCGDESSILKNCDGATRAQVTEFMRKMSYRNLATATPSPNDLIELGTSSEALGYMGFNDMLTTFFKKDQDRTTHSRKDEFRAGVWRFRGHAQQHFFQWVCSWARAARKPSDLGPFDDSRFQLPPLTTRETVVGCDEPLDGFLFNMPAVGLSEQRSERRRTIEARCEAAARLITQHNESSVAWGHLNPECDMMEKLIPGAVQISGSDSIERKEEVFNSFADGEIRVLVTKPEIAGFGLNWQHCAHQTFFPSHSFEQYYQAIRRSWRFGQTRPVVIDMITSEGESGVMENLKRKASNAEVLFANLVRMMGNAMRFETDSTFNTQQTIPTWLKKN